MPDRKKIKVELRMGWKASATLGQSLAKHFGHRFAVI